MNENRRALPSREVALIRETRLDLEKEADNNIYTSGPRTSSTTSLSTFRLGPIMPVVSRQHRASEAKLSLSGEELIRSIGFMAVVVQITHQQL